MLQRDKNMMHGLLSKHRQEQRKTLKFLQFALSNRQEMQPDRFKTRNKSLNIDSSTLFLNSKKSRNNMSITSVKNSLMTINEKNIVKMRNVHQVTKTTKSALQNIKSRQISHSNFNQSIGTPAGKKMESPLQHYLKIQPKIESIEYLADDYLVPGKFSERNSKLKQYNTFKKKSKSIAPNKKVSRDDQYEK